MLRFSMMVIAGTSVLALLSTGCAKKPAAKDVVTTTGSDLPRPTVNLSEELARACKVNFANIDRAPKFDFDDSELLPQDRDVLEQVAKCVTEGPLKGRHLSLTGRADPRGESEYNMVLGGYRADSVRDYLTKLGVAQDAIAQTSRGELDAKGIDEDSWQRDRRVDIGLR